VCPCGSAEHGARVAGGGRVRVAEIAVHDLGLHSPSQDGRHTRVRHTQTRQHRPPTLPGVALPPETRLNCVPAKQKPVSTTRLMRSFLSHGGRFWAWRRSLGFGQRIIARACLASLTLPRLAFSDPFRVPCADGKLRPTEANSPAPPAPLPADVRRGPSRPSNHAQHGNGPAGPGPARSGTRIAHRRELLHPQA
jgi:hypothetical protein